MGFVMEYLFYIPACSFIHHIVGLVLSSSFLLLFNCLIRKVVFRREQLYSRPDSSRTRRPACIGISKDYGMDPRIELYQHSTTNDVYIIYGPELVGGKRVTPLVAVTRVQILNPPLF